MKRIAILVTVVILFALGLFLHQANAPAATLARPLTVQVVDHQLLDDNTINLFFKSCAPSSEFVGVVNCLNADAVVPFTASTVQIQAAVFAAAKVQHGGTFIISDPTHCFGC